MAETMSWGDARVVVFSWLESERNIGVQVIHLQARLMTKNIMRLTTRLQISISEFERKTRAETYLVCVGCLRILQHNVWVLITHSAK